MNLPAVLAILGLACYSALIYVVVSSPVHTRGRVRRLFLLSLVVMVAWQLSALVVSLAQREGLAMAGYQSMTAIVVVFGVVYALFVRTFLMMPNTRGLALGGGILSAITLGLVLVARPSIISSVYWNSTTHFFLPTFGPLAAVVGIPYYALLGHVVVILVRAHRRAQQPLIRNRIQYLLLGWCVLLLGTLANFIPSLKDYPIDLMANVVNAVLITYAIFRYQLLDISLVIRKGLAYSIPTTLIAVVYFLIVFAVEKLLRVFVGYQVFLLSLVVAAITGVAAQPLRDRAQLLVDRLFFREKYDAQLMLQELSELATSILDIDRLTSILLDRLTTTMQVEQAAIMVKEEETARFRLVAWMGPNALAGPVIFRRDHPVVRWLVSRREPLTRYDMDVIPQFRALWGQEREELDRLQAELLIPLIARGELIGVLVMGPKLSEVPYTQDEQLTLSTLANQVAIAIENARLFGAAQDEIAERERAQVALRESQDRYRSLFEESPIALWEEDLSEVRAYLDSLRADGVEDLGAYLAAHPEEVARCASLIRVVSVNKATLEMYQASSVESFRDGLGDVLGDDARGAFLNGLVALAEGQTRFESETVQRTLLGNTRQIDLRWSVVPGYEKTLKMLLVSTMDITERKEREAMLHRRTARLELLREIDEAILEARSTEKTIGVALRRTRELLGCDGVGLMTLAAEIHRIAAVTPETEAKLAAAPATPPPPNAGATPADDTALRVLQEGRVYVADDLHTVANPLPALVQLRSLGYRSVVLVPVLHRQPQLVDALVLMAHAPQAFGSEATDVGREIAHSLALAIRHTEMRREIRERAQALEQQLARVNLFNEITRAIAARHDLESILRVVAQRLEDDFTDMASIWLGARERYTLAASGGRSEHPLMEIGASAQVAMPAEVPELARLFRGDVAYLPDLTDYDLPDLQDAVERLAVRSAVLAPLVVEGALFGVIISARRTRDAFSRAERDFIGGLGEHVALAIHQARLHEDVAAAYDELRETQRAVMQQERLRALGEMASGIAHDINNAISPVPLYTSLILNKGQLDDQARAYLRTIEVAVRDVEETVGRMRQFYRKREVEDLVPVDVTLAAQQAIELTRPRWRDVPQEQGITVSLKTDFQEGVPAVMGNEAEIRQAVTNLILNAVDAMPGGGTLTLSTRAEPGLSSSVVLEVSDTGIGMPAEIQERVFEPFFSTKGERGSGMGLATVYGTMQRHGGAVDLVSAVGEGTTMRLIFPVRKLVPEDTVDSVPSQAASLRILCVDDERLLRDALREVLMSEGHAVEVADGGASGLNAFRAARERGEPFEVVITDLGMPYVDGRKVARTVKEEAPGTPVILLTGWGQRMLAEHELPDDIDLLLSKPPTVEALNQALASVVSGRG